MQDYSSLDDNIRNAISCSEINHNWSIGQVLNIHNAPFMDLIYGAQIIHRKYHKNSIQLATLLNIKTGLCPEDCKYCPQSAHYAKKTGLKVQPFMDVTEVIDKAKTAKQQGATRFCMGAAWKKVKDGKQFDAVLSMVQAVNTIGMEACVTLGMLNKEQAQRLKDAGLTAYNHNLDTSPEFYHNIISTRTFDERLETISHVQEAGIEVCSGGIIGMGESHYDRAHMLQILANFNPRPASVPINALVAVQGTPLADRPPVTSTEMVRMIATARIIMPKCRVRLSAGRVNLSQEAQMLCIIAGANSIFYGDKLLTTDNNTQSNDMKLINDMNIEAEVDPFLTASAASSL